MRQKWDKYGLNLCTWAWVSEAFCFQIIWLINSCVNIENMHFYLQLSLSLIQNVLHRSSLFIQHWSFLTSRNWTWNQRVRLGYGAWSLKKRSLVPSQYCPHFCLLIFLVDIKRFAFTYFCMLISLLKYLL